MEHDTDLLRDNNIPSAFPMESTPKEPAICDSAEGNEAGFTPARSWNDEFPVADMKSPTHELDSSFPESIEEQSIETVLENRDTCQFEPFDAPNASYGAPNAPYGAPNEPYGTHTTPYDMPQQPVRYGGNPYEAGYYRQNQYANYYNSGQNPYYGNPYAPLYGDGGSGYAMAQRAPMPVRKKNRKPVVSLVLSLLAMGFLYYFPFVALVLGLIAICTAYIGLKEGRITTGQKVCGCIGLGLGIIALVISIAMLVMLLSLIIKVANTSVNPGGSIYR